MPVIGDIMKGTQSIARSAHTWRLGAQSIQMSALHPVQFSAAVHTVNIVQCSAVQCSVAEHSAHCAAQCSAVLCSAQCTL